MRLAAALAATAILAFFLTGSNKQDGVMRLPAGVVELHQPIRPARGTEVRGNHTILRMAGDFVGRAAIECADGVWLHDFSVESNLPDEPSGLPGYDTPFARFTRGNGILAEGVMGVRIENVTFRDITGFAVLASRARDITIDRVRVEHSGSRNAAGRNNATGGILFEEGTDGFRVTRSAFHEVLGNGVWTHSLYTSPRNAHGWIAWNRFDTIGRDAIQAGHATNVQVIGNSGRRIGQPADAIDAEPVAIDTAGDVDLSVYAGNRFDEIQGKCIDLDGFHDGAVRDNVCRDVNYGIVFNNTNPDMQSRNIRVTGNTIEKARLGGVFVIGTGHVIARNRLLDLNTTRCESCFYLVDEPDMLRSGIYLGRRAERPAPARGNIIEDNEITGYRMDTRCVGQAPDIASAWNVVRNNRCR